MQLFPLLSVAGTFYFKKQRMDSRLTCRSVRFPDPILLKESGHVSSSSSGGVHVDGENAEDCGQGDDRPGIHDSADYEDSGVCINYNICDMVVTLVAHLSQVAVAHNLGCTFDRFANLIRLLWINIIFIHWHTIQFDLNFLSYKTFHTFSLVIS